MANADETQWDAIIIGSGMGGMTTAAALSRFDHKVLLHDFANPKVAE